MQKYILLLVPVILLSAVNIVLAQNTAPQVDIKNISYDAQNNQCTVEYAITDNEQSEVEVAVSLSRDEGTTYLFPAEAITGTGLVASNEDLTLTITVNADSLSQYELEATDLLFKIAAKDKEAVDINAMLNRVTPELLQGYMSQIEGIRHRTAGRDHYINTQNLLEGTLMDGSFQNRSQAFNFDNQESKNVIGRKAGHTDEGATYMISAHYDTVDESPGADDNGSGVCGLMAALEILKDYEFEKSILIAAWDNEEDGLIGSTAFVNTHIKAYEKIEGLVNLEMIGYYSEEPNSQSFPSGFELLFADQSAEINANENKGDFIINVANTPSVDLMNAFNSAALTYVPDLKVIALESPGTGSAIPDLRRSDHAAFWQKGYPALMITDGANFRNPFYHSPEDKSEHLNFDFMSQVVKTTLATLADKAGIVSLGFAEGNFGNKVSVPSLHAENGFSFTLSGEGNKRMIAYTLPAQSKQAKLKLSNIEGQLIESFRLAGKTHTIEVELPAEGLYVLTLDVNGFKPYTKRIVYY